jgi:L-alanine-DL-glutamate epimerase-like enolase superfamily enzyme
MPAPISIAHTHVHSLRLASGAEALVARVVTTPGVVGYGFSLGTEATPARDMAQWDALARSRNAPLYALFGGRTRGRVKIARDKTITIDPFELLSIEAVFAEARSHQAFCLLAPHGHPWELSYCAALAGALPGDVVSIAIREEPSTQSIAISDAIGIEIDWSLEPAFAAIPWWPQRLLSRT